MLDRQSDRLDQHLKVLEFCQFLKSKFDQVQSQLACQKNYVDLDLSGVDSERSRGLDRKPNSKQTTTFRAASPGRKSEFSHFGQLSKKRCELKAQFEHERAPKAPKANSRSPGFSRRVQGLARCVNSHLSKSNANPKPNGPVHRLGQELTSDRPDENFASTDLKDKTVKIHLSQLEGSDYLSPNHRDQSGPESAHLQELRANKLRIEQLENRLQASESRADFLESKLHECRERLASGVWCESKPALWHEKLHSQQELIETLKTDLCSTNIRWSQRVAEAQARLESLKSQNRGQEQSVESQTERVLTLDKALEEKLSLLTKIQSRTRLLESSLRTRSEEIGMLNRTVSEMQRQIEILPHSSMSTGNRDSELDRLNRVANQLLRLSDSVNDF